MLPMAVGAFEALASGLMTEYYRLFEDALGGDEKESSLQDVLAFSSIEEAKEASVDRKVEAEVRPGLERWKKWFKERAESDFDKFCEPDYLTEIFQRRHVIVHNDAVVSRQYIEKIGPTAPTLGSRVEVDPDYLEAAFDELNVLGLGLIMRCWRKWVPSDEEDVASLALMKSVLPSYKGTLGSGSQGCAFRRSTPRNGLPKASFAGQSVDRSKTKRRC